MKRSNRDKKVTSCGGVVWRRTGDDLEFLFVQSKRSAPAWGIPKGKLESGESIEDCAEREVREEAGVTVVLGKKLPVVATSYQDTVKTLHAFLATVTDDSAEPGGHGDPDKEIESVKWFKASALPKLHYYQRALIEFAVKRLS